MECLELHTHWEITDIGKRHHLAMPKPSCVCGSWSDTVRLLIVSGSEPRLPAHSCLSTPQQQNETYQSISSFLQYELFRMCLPCPIWLWIKTSKLLNGSPLDSAKRWFRCIHLQELQELPEVQLPKVSAIRIPELYSSGHWTARHQSALEGAEERRKELQTTQRTGNQRSPQATK